MADERFPENDGRWISFPAHGTTRMSFTYALTKLRLSNFGTVPGKKLITPYIAARGNKYERRMVDNYRPYNTGG